MQKTKESDHQKAVIEWANHPAILKKYSELEMLFHIPNGGSRHPAEARHLKKQGVKPGVPDLFLPVSRGGFHGLFIEMKAEKGRLSDKQKECGRKLWEQGYMVCVCYGAKEAIEKIEWYLNLKDGINEYSDVGKEESESRN